METLFQDLRYAVRSLVQNPGFTIVAVLTLALGIGANSTIFSLTHTMLIRPLPYQDSDNVTFVLGWNLRLDRMNFNMPLANFIDLARESRTFEQLAAYQSWITNLTGGDRPERLQGYRVGTNTFSLLGVDALHGRTFNIDEGEPGSDRVVVLSHGLWQTRFGASTRIVDQEVQLNGQPYTVIGVMPPGFEFPQFNFTGDLWVPFAYDDDAMLANRGASPSVVVVGRIASDGSLEQAQAEMTTLSLGLESQYPELNADRGVRVISIQELIAEPIRPALIVLGGAVGLVLLIACANVTNLLLVRAAGRSREMAIRAALGAGRRRLIRQTLTESLVLGVLAGGAGLMLAVWGLGMLRAVQPDFVTDAIPSLSEIGVDSVTIGFTVLIALFTGFAFGLVPALQVYRTDLRRSFKEGGRSRVRKVLVVSEIAVSLVLLTTMGLLVRSFVNLLDIHPGFEAQNVLAANLTLPEHKYADLEERRAMYRRTFESLATLPGVTSASAVNTLPFSTSNDSTTLEIEGRPEPLPGQALGTNFRVVGPDYFRTLTIPMVAGRTFGREDSADAPQVAIVNQTLARRYFADEDPVGKRFRFGGNTDTPPRVIIGIVGDVIHGQLTTGPDPETYVPLEQYPLRQMTLVLQTARPPELMANLLRQELSSIDPEQPVSDITTMEQMIANSILPQSAAMFMMLIFGFLALVLAMVGLYGVIACSVSQSTREIGVRMALGARPRDILAIFGREGFALVALGTVIGMGLRSH